MLSYIVGYSVWVRSWKYDRRWGWNVIYWINVPLKCHFPIILFRLPTFDLSHSKKKNSLGGNDWIPYQQVWLWKEILIFCVMLAHCVSLVDRLLRAVWPPKARNKSVNKTCFHWWKKFNFAISNFQGLRSESGRQKTRNYPPSSLFPKARVATVIPATNCILNTDELHFFSVESFTFHILSQN